MALQLALLGPFQLTLAGAAPPAVTSPAIKGLLAYLALEPRRPQPRPLLAELLWPDRPPGLAAQNLRQSLTRLRKALPEEHRDLLHVTRQSVTWNPAAAVQVDVLEFKRLLAENSRHTHPDLQPLAQAAALYRGDFLADVLVDSPPFDEWALLQREWLRRQALETLERLAELHLGQNDGESAYAYAWRQVELDAWREPAHRQLMRSLALSGRRTAALRQYDELRRILEQELGVAPDPASTALYNRIKDERMAAPPGTGRAAGQAYNLPVQHTPFIGRENELAHIAERLSDPHCRLLTLVGPGGVGKSRLAQQAAAALAKNYPDGAWFVPLAAARSAAELLQALESAFAGSLQPPPPGGSLGARMERWLAAVEKKELLLVLDNYEQLLPELELLAQLPERARALRLLVTSRRPLGLRAEWLLDVEGLPYPESELTPGAGEFPAVALFAGCAARLQAGFAPGEHNLPALARLCRLVHGYPLALELAAGWIRHHTPGEIADRVAANLDFLATEMPDVPARQRSLRAVFHYSWALLEPAARETLAQAAVFRGGFSRAAAAYVIRLGAARAEPPPQSTGSAVPISADALTQPLEALSAQALLHREPGGRYTLHPLLAQYAAEQLAAEPPLQRAVAARHSAYFSALLERLADDFTGENMSAAAETIQADLDNVRAAWEWAVAQRAYPHLARALDGLGRFYVLRSLSEEGLQAFSAAVQAVRAHPAGPQGGPQNRALLAALLVRRARFQSRLGHPAAVIDTLKEAIELAQQIGDQRTETLAGLFLSVAHTNAGASRAARAAAQRTLALAQKIGWRKLEADAWRSLGNLDWNLGELASARREYEASLPLSREIGDLRGTSATLSNIGNVCQAQGDYTAALDYMQQALALERQVDDQTSAGQTLAGMGIVWRDLGDYAQAAACFDQALQILRSIEDRRNLAYVLDQQAYLQYETGALETASRTAGEALALVTEQSEASTEAFIWQHLGQIRAAQGRREDAEEAYRRALELRRALGQHGLLRETQAALAALALAGDDRQQASIWVMDILDGLGAEALSAAALGGADHPAQVLLTCIQVLDDCRDPRAGAVRQAACEFLQARVARIADLELRASFLSRRAHPELLRLCGG